MLRSAPLCVLGGLAIHRSAYLGELNFMALANRVTDTVKSVSLFWFYRQVFTMVSLDGQVCQS